MPFRPRNPYYLRISKKDVLPVYLYLDDRHIDWMSEITLQHVLEDLRPKILPKLQNESDLSLGLGGPPSAKKATVDTHRGDTYQFCYFLRKTQPHSVVLKTRTFTATPLKQSFMPPPPVPAKALKRKSKSNQISRKKQKTKGKGRAVDNSDSEDAISSDNDHEEVQDASSPRQSTRSRRPTVDQDGDELMENEQNDPDDDDDEYIPIAAKNTKERAKTIQFSIEIEDEEEKPKPLLHLKYQGFKILGSCLCVVVEPWPAIPLPSRAPSVLRSTPRASSIAPRDFVTAQESSSRARSKTPLFLPDPDDGEGTQTPFPDAIHVRPLPVPLYDDDRNLGWDEDVDYGGMIEFSQVLNAAGDARAGALDDEDDMEGAVFFGDADEVREL
ncbi:hypothetical protein BDP27DRAFT_1312521 [Rhodocollybia butyracea]|uniref:Uncharacterized protein n=1 Tax=Rhodocollybia butyracea TaxID=206335 RepID=A0A9P5Q7R8_9AGAR|nr:hypothetical protein BDP27DRAFT_1312521 [Rhodocollybia butyracea]